MALTNIEWAKWTWNPWRGCMHSVLADGSDHPGCTNCYAEAMAARNPKVLGHWGKEGTRVVAAEPYWRKPLEWNKAAEQSGQRERVFCASLADVFEDWDGECEAHCGGAHYTADDCNGRDMVASRDAAGCDMDGYHYTTLTDCRWRLFSIIDQTPWLDWLLLTKRPGNIPSMWPMVREAHLPDVDPGEYYRPNVWLITSVSDQPTADELIPKLLELRHVCPVLGISAEPLVGTIDITDWRYQLDWVIVGGESGPQRRHVPTADVTELVDQCLTADIPCFVKQDVALKPGQQGRIPDRYWQVKQFPKSHAAVRGHPGPRLTFLPRVAILSDTTPKL